MLKKSDFKRLNTTKGLEYLLQSDKLDFEEVAKQLLFEEEIIKLQARLIKVQNRVVQNEERVMILVEGREFSGKGGAIHVFTNHLNPRSLRMVALRKPTPLESSQWYFKRYIEQLPEKGEMVFFDRSWYNRALVEPVNGFCTENEYATFMKEVNHFERMLSEDGIKLIKIYLAISKEEQRKRIEYVRQNPLRSWELTPVDLRAVELWDIYTKYEKRMLRLTNTRANRWHIFKSDDKRIARLKATKKILQLLGPAD